jgi:adenosylhomocysteinase
MEISVDWFYEKMQLVKEFAKEIEVDEVAICLPLEYKTAVLIYEMSRHTTVLPVKLDDHSTKKGAVEWLKDRGISILRKRDAVKAKYFLDCAAVLSRIAAKSRDEIRVVELTKTGEDYLRLMEERIRVRAISVDFSTLKGIGENVHGTAFGLLDVLLRLNIYLPGKKAVIVGYGRVGKGCARILRNLGCSIAVLDTSPQKLLEAEYEGFGTVSDLSDADIIVTCTGRKNAITAEMLRGLKEGAVLLNLGAEYEIEIAGELVADYGGVKKYRLVKDYYIVADGYAANLAIGNGTPIEVMDRTFSAALLSLNYLKESFDGIRPLPKEIEEKILKVIRQA